MVFVFKRLNGETGMAIKMVRNIPEHTDSLFSGFRGKAL